MLFVWNYLALHDWFFCATFSHLAPPKWELHLFMIPTLVPSSLACLLHLGGLPPDVLAFLVPLFLLPLTPFHIHTLPRPHITRMSARAIGPAAHRATLSMRHFLNQTASRQKTVFPLGGAGTLGSLRGAAGTEGVKANRRWRQSEGDPDGPGDRQIQEAGRGREATVGLWPLGGANGR